MANVTSMYSNIVLVLNFFTFNHPINTALYLSNWACFFANALLMIKNPYHVAYLTRDVPVLKSMPLSVVHVLNQGYHILPLVLFRKRQTVTETLSPLSFVISAVFFLSYLLVIPDRSFRENYDINSVETFVLAAGVFFSLFIFSIFFNAVRSKN